MEGRLGIRVRARGLCADQEPERDEGRSGETERGLARGSHQPLLQIPNLQCEALLSARIRGCQDQPPFVSQIPGDTSKWGHSALVYLLSARGSLTAPWSRCSFAEKVLKAGAGREVRVACRVFSLVPFSWRSSCGCSPWRPLTRRSRTIPRAPSRATPRRTPLPTARPRSGGSSGTPRRPPPRTPTRRPRRSPPATRARSASGARSSTGRWWPIHAALLAEREGARVRLGGRQRDRDLSGPGPHPRHGVGPGHRHADAGERDHGLQHLLQRPGPPHGRVPVRRRREQERPARRASSRRTSSIRTPIRGAWGRTWRRAAGTRASPPCATGRC